MPIVRRPVNGYFTLKGGKTYVIIPGDSNNNSNKNKGTKSEEPEQNNFIKYNLCIIFKCLIY